MFRCCLLAVIVYATIESVHADGTYTYNFKLPKLSAEMVSKMNDKLKLKIFDIYKKMEEKSKYTQCIYEYAFTVEADQAMGGYCSTQEDVEKLDKYTETFKTAFIDCFNQLNATSSFDEIVSEVKVKIETIDQNAKTEADACSGDEACETKAYKTMHDNLNKSYKGMVPLMRLEEDKVKAKGISELVKCIIPEVAESYKTMVKDTASIQSCLALGASGTQESDAANEVTDEDTKITESEVVESDKTNTEDEAESINEETE